MPRKFFYACGFLHYTKVIAKVIIINPWLWTVL